MKGDEVAVEPAKLVRGLSGTSVNKNEALANLVVTALAEDEGWKGVKADQVTVKDVSGFGGSKTFKVTAPPRRGRHSARSVLEVPTVVLHSRPDDHEGHLM